MTSKKTTKPSSQQQILPSEQPLLKPKKADQKKRKKQPVAEATNKGKKTGSAGKSTEMFGWMDKLRVEMEQADRNVHKQISSNGGGKQRVVSTHEEMSIPPEAMEILKEALVAAAQDSSDEKLNEETARTLATNFIQATAASARQSSGGDSQGKSRLDCVFNSSF